MRASVAASVLSLMFGGNALASSSSSPTRRVLAATASLLDPLKTKSDGYYSDADFVIGEDTDAAVSKKKQKPKWLKAAKLQQNTKAPTIAQQQGDDNVELIIEENVANTAEKHGMDKRFTSAIVSVLNDLGLLEAAPPMVLGIATAMLLKTVVGLLSEHVRVTNDGKKNKKNNMEKKKVQETASAKKPVGVRFWKRNNKRNEETPSVKVSKKKKTKKQENKTPETAKAEKPKKVQQQQKTNTRFWNRGKTTKEASEMMIAKKQAEVTQWKERYEQLVQEKSALKEQLQAAEKQLVKAQQETHTEQQDVAYWQAVARNHEANVRTAVQTERAASVEQLKRLKAAMITVVEQERADMRRMFQTEAKKLRQSFLAEA